jgi:hypothetical protein
MKAKTNLPMAISSLLILLLTSCGGGLTTSKNEFLGEIPSIQKYYSTKIQEKNKELKECTDMEKAFKLGKEADLLKQEWDAKLEESLKANPLTAALPFEPLKNQPYTVTGISVDKCNSMGFGIKLSLKFNTDIKFEYKDIWIYYLAIDKEGKEIEGTKLQSLIRQELGKDLKAGTDVEATGCWTKSAISTMENFAKIKFITKEEYDKK